MLLKSSQLTPKRLCAVLLLSILSKTSLMMLRSKNGQNGKVRLTALNCPWIIIFKNSLLVPPEELAHRGLQLPPISSILPKSTQTRPMLTQTKTVEVELDATAKVKLDTQLVVDAYMKALDAGDKKLALAYAKIFMLKAFAL